MNVRRVVIMWALIVFFVAPGSLRADAPITAIKQGRELMKQAPDRRGETHGTVRAVITWEPLITSTHHGMTYMQDASGGIRIYVEDSDLLSGIHEGDQIEAEGNFEIYKGVTEFAATAVRHLGSTRIPEPASISIEQLRSGEFAGSLVQITGDAHLQSDSKGHREVMLQQGSAICSVHVPMRLLLDSKFLDRLQNGGRVHVTGIAEYVNDAGNPMTQDAFLMPRERGDISFPRQLTWSEILLGIIGGGVLVLIGWLWSARSKAQAELERKQQIEHLQTRLRQAERLEAIGRLAGGIAHDFNNILGIIIGYGDLLLEEPCLDAGSRNFAEQIRSSALRAAALTNQLLVFSKRKMLAPVTVDLNSVLRDMREMLERLVGEDVEVAMKFAAEPCTIKADLSQIEQVIMNLAVNARDAMPTGGRLSIRTERRASTQTSRRATSIESDEYVSLYIADTGVGMDEQTRAHIFEPFFTTKPKEKGTGLGLATVYGIVQQSGGSIAAQSELGKGTCFEIHFPLVAESVPEVRPKVTTTDALLAPKTILLVEDESQLRKLASNLLVNLGYRVLEAENGRAALQLASGLRERIDLLLTDVVMPGLSGREVAETLKQQRPEMKVIFMSGYTDDVILRYAVQNEGVAFLQKPFTRETLTRTLTEVLTGADVGGKMSSGASASSRIN